MQKAMDFIREYFNVNNIPTNNDKSHILIFKDHYYVKLSQFKDEFEKYVPIIMRLQRKIVARNQMRIKKHRIPIYSLTKVRICKIINMKFDNVDAENVINYAIREKIWYYVCDENDDLGGAGPKNPRGIFF